MYAWRYQLFFMFPRLGVFKITERLLFNLSISDKIEKQGTLNVKVWFITQLLSKRISLAYNKRLNAIMPLTYKMNIKLQEQWFFIFRWGCVGHWKFDERQEYSPRVSHSRNFTYHFRGDHELPEADTQSCIKNYHHKEREKKLSISKA